LQGSELQPIFLKKCKRGKIQRNVSTYKWSSNAFEVGKQPVCQEVWAKDSKAQSKDKK